jgi:hypothetical protein
VRCMGRNDKKSESNKVVCHPGFFQLPAGANRQIQGLRGRKTTHYQHAKKLAGWVFLLHSAQCPFPAGPSDVAAWQTVRAHCDPEEGKSLTWRWSPGSSLGPQGPCRAAAEEEERTFGPEFWALMLQEIWKIQSRRCEDPTIHLAGGQRPSGLISNRPADVSGVKVGIYAGPCRRRMLYMW